MRKGFTLFEVIITLFLISAVILIIFSAFNKTAALAQHNYWKRQAIDLANSFLEVETYGGPVTNIENPFPNLKANKKVDRHGAVSEVEITVTWSDPLNNNSQIVLTRNYYLGVN